MQHARVSASLATAHILEHFAASPVRHPPPGGCPHTVLYTILRTAYHDCGLQFATTEVYAKRWPAAAAVGVLTFSRFFILHRRTPLVAAAATVDLC